jgi:hypothetical protein
MGYGLVFDYKYCLDYTYLHNHSYSNIIGDNMNKDIKARYRNKVGKIIIEVWNGEKWLYVKTLSNPLKEFNAECLDKVSNSKEQNVQNNAKECAQSLLREPLEKDIPPKKVDVDSLFPTHEQLKKVLEKNGDTK